MPLRPLRLHPRQTDEQVREGLARIREQFSVPADFPAGVHAEAATARAETASARADLLDLPFFTIDPPGSLDLDQAMHLERRSGGYRVRYAIADVAAFVRPGGAIDAEAHRRGVTLYLPDAKAPLHPPRLSEDAASLLPGVPRAAVVWTIDLDDTGAITAVDLGRAQVRSHDRLDYAGARPEDPRIALLAEVGELLIAAEAGRGGVSLPVPEQDVTHGPHGWQLEFRGGLPSEQWNAQISLLAGRAAAKLMLEGGIGLLRTMPPPASEAVERLRRAGQALGIDWPSNVGYGEAVRALDPADPRHAAFLHEATGLMRGAGYTAFDGTPPPQAEHAAVAAPYAHVTAPLRRLADRYATEVCLALVAGSEVPPWVRTALPALPEEMGRSLRHSGDVDRACVDLVEAVLLSERVGEDFEAVVVDVSEDRPGGLVQLLEPAVLARCDGDRLPLGDHLTVRLTKADPLQRQVRFSAVK
jgi:exoribonuclease R